MEAILFQKFKYESLAGYSNIYIYTGYIYQRENLYSLTLYNRLEVAITINKTTICR